MTCDEDNLTLLQKGLDRVRAKLDLVYEQIDRHDKFATTPSVEQLHRWLQLVEFCKEMTEDGGYLLQEVLDTQQPAPASGEAVPAAKPTH